MRLHRMTDSRSELYDRAYALYRSAFPHEERRDEAEHARAMKNPDYHFDLIMNGDELIGVMLYWERNEFLYLEHFTTLPEVRGKGYGAKALELLKQKNKPILLEIEPPVDELTKRRYAFYCRNGFEMNPHYHIQAKYHIGDEDLELKILSYPYVLSAAEYSSFIDYMHKEIGILPNCSDEVTVRPMSESDDVMQIAKLIYLTDPYIYPYWFDSVEEGMAVLSKMIDLPTLYNRKNITVAVTADGFVAGMTVSVDCPFEEKKEHIREAFRLAGVESDARTDKVFEDYYLKMMEDSEGHYIANVAVDPDHRKKGIASSLLCELLKDKAYCHLECVQVNTGSWRLYQRHGFRIVQEYPGVFDVPCYKMVYKKEE